MNTTARFSEPGLGTLLAHVVMVALLGATLAPLVMLRVILAPLAEVVIRATDTVHDALAERLSR